MISCIVIHPKNSEIGVGAGVNWVEVTPLKLEIIGHHCRIGRLSESHVGRTWGNHDLLRRGEVSINELNQFVVSAVFAVKVEDDEFLGICRIYRSNFEFEELAVIIRVIY